LEVVALDSVASFSAVAAALTTLAASADAAFAVGDGVAFVAAGGIGCAAELIDDTDMILSSRLRFSV
jgi:hypothetical protein